MLNDKFLYKYDKWGYWIPVMGRYWILMNNDIAKIILITFIRSLTVIKVKVKLLQFAAKYSIYKIIIYLIFIIHVYKNSALLMIIIIL